MPRQAQQGPQEPTRKLQDQSKLSGGTLALGEGFKSLVGDVKEFGSVVKNTFINKDHYDNRAAAVLGQEKEFGAWKTEQDAARHLLAVGNVSRTVGPTGARVSAKLYELIFGNADEEDAQMDAHNNEVAARLGKGAKSSKEVEERVGKAMKKAAFNNFSDKDVPVFLKLHQSTKPTDTE
jgi:hypothetical protein